MSADGIDFSMIEGHEATVIGYLINNSETAISEIGQELAPELFACEKHRLILEAIGDLSYEGKTVSIISIGDQLRKNGKIDAVGGAAYVTHLFTTYNLNKPAMEYALEQLREARAHRGTMSLGQRMVAGNVTTDEAAHELSKLLRDSQGAARLTVRSAAEIIEMKLDEHDCLMGDRLLAKGQSLVMVGAGSIGKSRTVLQLAAACITGRKWCGIETHAQETQWLILQTENSNHRLKMDLGSLKNWLGEQWEGVANNLFIHTLETDQDGMLMLSDSRVIRDLHAVINQVQPDVIVLDPLKDMMIGDPNSDVDMQATTSAISALCKSGNRQRAIIVLHHALTGRAGAAKAVGYERGGFGRNSKVLQSWTRAQINVAPGSPDDPASLVLTCGKNSNGKEFESFAIRLNPATMIYEVDELFDLEAWRADITSNGRNKKKAFSASAVSAAIGEGEMTKPELTRAIMNETGCARSRAYELVEEAETAKLIKQDKVTKTYALFP